MANYTNESTIVIFPNDKGGNPKRPDYRGKIQLNGVAYKVSLWERVSKDGKNKRYISGPIERDEADQQPAAPAPAPASTTATEDVPF